MAGYEYRDILIIGNGFDIYHHLPTRYTDFLFLVKNWERFHVGFEKNRYMRYMESGNSRKQYKIIDKNPFSVSLDQGRLTIQSLDDFAMHEEALNEEKVKKFATYLNNLWIEYFLETEYDKEKWIDLEAEIEKVLLAIEEFFSKDIINCVGKNMEEVLNPNTYSIIAFLIRKSGCLPIPFGVMGRKEVEDCIYGGVKEKLLESLRNQLGELIQALYIYMDEFVGNIKPAYYSEQIDKLKDVNILNFNYTYTYKTIYGSEHFNKWHFVHGSLEDNNLVLGIPDSTFDENLDYVYFQKYFQRIQKRTGAFYLDWIPKVIDGYLPSYQIDVHIMGHSLGMTDRGILDHFFKAEDSIKKIYIYYHNQKNYEDLVIALIKLFDKEFVINQTGLGRIQFIELKPEASMY